MTSRNRASPSHFFDAFVEVVAPDPKNADSSPWILQTYPPTYKDKEQDKLKSVPQFVFPCKLEISAVQNFSFVITNIEGKFTYGFCRQAPHSETALVLLSSLPWHETFYRVLNHAAELTHASDAGELERFLEAAYKARVPEPGSVFHVNWGEGGGKDFTAQCPHMDGLPTIPENRNVTEYYNAVGIHNMLVIFASMLYERRIIITSRRLSRLSACVQAANTLIYPMDWQHIFIPILPKHLIDYLSAPMPFLIGVPAPMMQRVRLHELGEAVILDADTNVIQSPFTDLESLPLEVSSNLKRSLKSHKDLLGDSVARAFLQALVHLIGGYRDALKFRQGEKITFSEEGFITSRSASLQPFLEQMLQLQIFRQFIEERLNMLNSGKGFSDEFEMEAVRFQERLNQNSKLKTGVAQISSSVKKEGGAIVKAVKSKFGGKKKSSDSNGFLRSKSLRIKSIKSSSLSNVLEDEKANSDPESQRTIPSSDYEANPAVKNAVKSVKDGSKGLQSKSKSAYREMKSKMKNSSSHLDAASMIAGGNRHAPLGHTASSNSAPNSPRGSRAMSFSSASGSESSSNTSGNSGAIALNNNSSSGGGGSNFSSASNLQRFATGAESLDMKTNSGTVLPMSGEAQKSNTLSSKRGQAVDALNFGRVLKYERFDPPPISNSGPSGSSLTNPFSTPSSGSGFKPLISPDMEPPKPLDLNLMKDLEDMIYLKTDLSSGYGNNRKEGGDGNGSKATGGSWGNQAAVTSGPPINRHSANLTSSHHLPSAISSNNFETSFLPEKPPLFSSGTSSNGSDGAKQYNFKQPSVDLIKFDSEDRPDEEDVIFDPLLMKS